MSFPTLLLSSVWSVCSAPTLHDEIRVADPTSLRRAVAAAKPGDRILVAPGIYRGTLFLQDVHGAAGKPIILAAADPDRPPQFVGAVQFSKASHLELCDLHFTGSPSNGLNIDNGGVPDTAAHHVTLRNLKVTDVGPKGNRDGIKLSGLDDFLVVDCTVERWGDGGSAIDMVGCHRGVINRCTFRGRGAGGSNGVQAKGGSAEVTVHRCRFEDCGDRAVQIGGSTNLALFRPPLEQMPADAKYEAKAVTVEGCTFVGGKAAVAFTGADGAVVRFNTIYRPESYAVRILQENTAAGFVPSRNGVVEDNVVVFRSAKWWDGGVNIGPNTAPQTFKFAKNLWYCEDRPANSAPKLPVAEADGVVGKDPQFRDPAKGDFAVQPGSPATGRGAHALPKKDK